MPPPRATSSKPPTLITLAPGAKANATLGVANAENYPASACKPTAAAKLKVFPPNQTQAIEAPFTTTGCAVSSTHQLSVTAVTISGSRPDRLGVAYWAAFPVIRR